MHNDVTFNLLPSASEIISMEEFLLFSYNLSPAPQLNFVSFDPKIAVVKMHSCYEETKTRF